MPTLYIYPDAGKSFSFEIPETKVVIGRSPKNDVVLEDQCCSSYHASVYPVPGGYAVRDMGSKNGTLVNGRLISDEVVLRKGDSIQIGDTRIHFDRERCEPGSKTVIRAPDLLAEPAKIAADILDLPYDLPQDRFLGHVMDVVIRHIPIDRGILMLRKGSQGELVKEVVKVPDGSKRTENLPVSWTIIQRALDGNEAILIPDVQADPVAARSASVTELKIHSAMCVPLWNDRDVIGVIYADRMSTSGAFGESDLRTLAFLARQAAVKIGESEARAAAKRQVAWERDQRRAREIQEGILPKNDPVFEPFDISGSARPCCYVGGDYYDFIRLSEDRMGVVVADVTGTGSGAAILMGHLSGFLRAEVRATGDLAAIAARLNDDIHQRTESNTFISFFLGVVNRRTAEMSYVNAGHNLPFLLRPDGEVRTLNSTGFCLGMFPSVTYEVDRVSLDPGSLLCLYTDGAVESVNEKREEFGEERLLAVLEESIRLPARAIVEKIYDAVFRFTGNPEPDDDITLVVLKNEPRGGAP